MSINSKNTIVYLRHEAVDIRESLESEVAYIPGGRDRENRPLVVFDIPAVGEPTPITRNNLDVLIEYFLSIFSFETKSSGLTLLIDARLSTWRTIRTYTRRIIQHLRKLCPKSSSCVIVVRSDGFWEKPNVENYCIRPSREDEQPIYVFMSRLENYVDINQLPHKFRGCKPYNHGLWIENRIRMEKFIRDSINIIEKLNKQQVKLSKVDFSQIQIREENLISYQTNFEIAKNVHEILQTGKFFMNAMSRETAQDIIDTIKYIDKLIDAIEQKQIEMEEAQLIVEKNEDLMVEFKTLEDAVASVTNWILGPADSMLNAHYQIGYDVVSAETLRIQHEKLELECRDTYGKYAEILYKIDSVPNKRECGDLKSQRDFMDFVCRSFATRLERRRNVLITSQRFFRLVSEYFDKTSDVFDKLIMGSRTGCFLNANFKLLELEKSQHELEKLENELEREGEKLSDILSMPVKDALCRDIQIDYTEDIINIRDVLDATNARKNIFNDSVELQKLTLKQVALILTYENDAEQAIEWISDLFNVFISSYLEIGCNVAELQSQKQQLQNFEETSKGTYDYGCQLLNGAKVLRISCKLDLQRNMAIMNRLHSTWHRLRSMTQEQLTRLRVCIVFHRNVTDHCMELQQLIQAATVNSSRRNSRSAFALSDLSISEDSVDVTFCYRAEIRDILAKREKLLLEVGRMIRLGRLLRSRLKEPLVYQRMTDASDKIVVSYNDNNASAVQSISTKLLEVTRLAEKLDTRLCEAGARSKSLNSTEEKLNDELIEITTASKEAENHTKEKELSGIIQEFVTKTIINDSNHTSDHVSIADQESIIEEYITATEGSSTPIQRSRSESFLSSEYEDAFVSLASPKLDENQIIKQADVVSIEKFGIKNPSNSSKGIVGDNMDKAVVVKKTIQDFSGKIFKETTETKTLKVSQDIRFNIKSYKYTSNESLDHVEQFNNHQMEDIQCFVVDDNSTSSIAPINIEINHEEQHYVSPQVAVTYNNSVVTGNHYNDFIGINTQTNQEVNKLEKTSEGKRSTTAKVKMFNDCGQSNQTSNANNHQRSGEKNSMTQVTSIQKQQFPNIETTTIGTIALQSGDTRVVIALLENSECLRLKVLEIQPVLTHLGENQEDAKALLHSHDEVLEKIQTKQNPVDEMWKQADESLLSQKPLCEAMAENLSLAWKDICDLLEKRKLILERNVLFQCRAEECRESMRNLETACKNMHLPIEIDIVKLYLKKLHENRKLMLETLMGSLKDGKALLDRLRDIMNEGSIDSRPHKLTLDAESAIHKVEGWLENLHDKRNQIEKTFQRRKQQLEQCLGLAILASDLSELENHLTDRSNKLAARSDQLGDSIANTELLIFEIKKLQIEAKEFQDNALRITKSTESLISPDISSFQSVSEKAYAVLETAANYVNDLNQYEVIVKKSLAFFESAVLAFSKLDELEVQLATTEYPARSASLMLLHSNTAKIVDKVTNPVLSTGHALLEQMGRKKTGTDGVRRTVEAISDRKVRIIEQCTAHSSENQRLSSCLDDFSQQHEELTFWLNDIIESFLKGHQDMGSDLVMAHDFYQIHVKLLEELNIKEEDVNSLDQQIIQSNIFLHLQKHEHTDVLHKIKTLQNSWIMARSTLEGRLQLSSMYFEFHKYAAELEIEMDQLEYEIRQNTDCMSEEKISILEKQWEKIEPVYSNLFTIGKQFLEESIKVVDSYLDVPRARLSAGSIIEKFSNRKSLITQSYESMISMIALKKEMLEEQTQRYAESKKKATVLRDQLYPLIKCDSIEPFEIIKSLRDLQIVTIPRLDHAILELETQAEKTGVPEPKNNQSNYSVSNNTCQLLDQLRTSSANCKIVLDDLINLFDKLLQVEQTVRDDCFNAKSCTSSNHDSLHEVRDLLEKLDTFSQSISKTFKSAKEKSKDVLIKIQNLEPTDHAQQDYDKINKSFEKVIDHCNSFIITTRTLLQERLNFYLFGDDLDKINVELRDLENQLKTISAWFGESSATAKNVSQSFSEFEKTLTILEARINKFVNETKINTGHRLPKIETELYNLQDKLRTLKDLTKETRDKINSSIQYFTLLEEAQKWFKEGSQLLLITARKATSIKTAKETENLLNEIDTFIKGGEEYQETRIENIRILSPKIFGTNRLSQFNDLVVENREMLDSFASTSSELRSLLSDLQGTEIDSGRIDIEVMQSNAPQQIALLKSIHKLKKKEAKVKNEEKNANTQTELTSNTMNENAIESTTITNVKVEKKEEHISTIYQQGLSPAIKLYDGPAENEETLIIQKNKGKNISEIEVTVEPEFIKLLKDACVCEGEQFKFECQVIGHPRPKVIWVKDGIEIMQNPDYSIHYNNDGSCTLIIEETFAEDSGIFSCRATNTAGSTEIKAKLEVKESSTQHPFSPPMFITKFNDEPAVEGLKYELRCKVKGNPIPTVQWFRNDDRINIQTEYISTYKNNGEAILQFKKVRENDQDLYSCVAYNQIGKATLSTKLKIDSTSKENIILYELPKITKISKNVSIKEGDMINLECEAFGCPIPTFFWIHDGKFIDEIKSSTIRLSELSSKCCLIIPEASPKDAGRYEIVAKNNAGQTRCYCDVTVNCKSLNVIDYDSKKSEKNMDLTAPRIKLPLKDLAVEEGASVRLDCVIIGKPEPEVIWYHDTQPVKESTDFQLLFQGDRCSLIIQEAFIDDSGTYKVIAINSEGKTSSECLLKITRGATGTSDTPPKFVKLLSDLLVAEGEQAIFECSVTGEPRPIVVWYLNNEPLIECERIKLSNDASGSNVLKIVPTLPKDKGNYTAKATNEAGEAKSFAKLIVKVLNDFEQIEKSSLKTELKKDISSNSKCIIENSASNIQWVYNENVVNVKNDIVPKNASQVPVFLEKTNTQCENTPNVAENSVEKAESQTDIGEGVKVQGGQIATIEVPTSNFEMQASSSCDKYIASERTTGDSGSLSDNQTITKTSSIMESSSTTHTSMKKEYITTTNSSTLSSCPVHQSNNTSLKKSSHSSALSTDDNRAAPVMQSKTIEEFERIVQDVPDGELRQEKTVIVTKDLGGSKQKECKHQIQIQKPCRKQTAPRFVSPVTGMIVDQGTDIVLEGIVDGFPLPKIMWTKNGQEIVAKNGINMSYDHNHVKMEIKDVKVKDAGRYTCTAKNDIGNASSTADLVVKKTIFPPVFGRRLQAQVVKKGDRVVMEVEITGTPDPEVTWWKDDEPLIQTEFRMKRQGNSYYLFINKAEKEHAGKYMVRAANAGGEAQSIADFAVFEPTPDTMVEMHKTFVYENLADKNAKKPCCGIPTEIPSANLTTEQITTTMIQPSAAIKTPIPATSSLSAIRTIKTETTGGSQKASRTEMISSSVESHHTETKSEQKFHMKLEHKPAPLDAFKKEEKIERIEKTVGNESNNQENSDATANENIETSTIARKDALKFFESMTQGSENFARGPKEMIRLVGEDDGTGPGCDVKVNQLTKNYEKSTKFEDVIKDQSRVETISSKKAVQDIFNKFEKDASTRGIDSSEVDFPFEEHKLPQLQCTRTILEDVTASGSPIHGTLTISKLAAQSESAEAMLKGFNLVPEPPPEIGYAPKPEEVAKKRLDVTLKAKQLQESFEKNRCPMDVPVGGVKTFPSSAPSQHQLKQLQKMQPLSIPPPFDLVKQQDCHIKDSVSTYTDKQVWNVPNDDYKISSSETKQEIELKPDYRMTQTTVESSTTLEKITQGSKKTHVTEKKLESPPLPTTPNQQPIIYNAETIKVDHTINTIEEKSITEKYVAECDVHKSEIVKNKYESIKKQTARPWPDDSGCDLKSPGLVKNLSKYSKPRMKLYHETTSSYLKPGSTPEMAYATGPPGLDKKYEQKLQKNIIEKTLQKSIIQKPAYINSTAEQHASECRQYQVPKTACDLKVTESEPFSQSSVSKTGDHQYLIPLKPGSPPQYLQTSMSYCTKYCKPESPKLKSKCFHQESGYMADTEETLRGHEAISEAHSSSFKTKSNFTDYKSSQSQKCCDSCFCSHVESCSFSPKTELQRTSCIEKIIEKAPHTKCRSTYEKEKLSESRGFSRVPKGELRESDYESDYDSNKYSSSLRKQISSYQTVPDIRSSSSTFKTSFNGSGKSTMAPSTFAKKKHEKVEKNRETVKDAKYRPKSVLVPGSPPEIAYAPLVRKSYYEGCNNTPYHDAVDAETKQTMHLDESTTNTRRIIKVEQSSRVIKYGDLHQETRNEPSEVIESKKKKDTYYVATPKKFVRGNVYESDYENDSDCKRIRAKWAPSESENEEPKYRKVNAPKIQETKGPIITMPSDTENEKLEKDRKSIFKEKSKCWQVNNDHVLTPGSPPEFAIAPAQSYRKNVNYMASENIKNMKSNFRSKTEKFSSQIQSDLEKRNKLTIKRPVSTDKSTQKAHESGVSREESRVSQYGTKQIDPATGLVYFKYDFGYEFGIVLSEEVQKLGVNKLQKTGIQKVSESDIEVPVIHEYDSRQRNGYKMSDHQNHTFPRKSGGKFSKSVKWEQNSESEFSEFEDLKGSSSKTPDLPSALESNYSISPRWNTISPRPTSISPRMSSSRNAGILVNIDQSRPDSPWSGSNNERIIPVATEVVKPYVEILPKKTPLFTTPLKDIAVVSGQSARFECIVQGEPQPKIQWSKDGEVLGNSTNTDIHYRNGVCRLTLNKTSIVDAGTYICTAVNGSGSTATSAILQVPGNRRSIYGVN